MGSDVILCSVYIALCKKTEQQAQQARTYLQRARFSRTEAILVVQGRKQISGVLTSTGRASWQKNPQINGLLHGKISAQLAEIVGKNVKLEKKSLKGRNLLNSVKCCLFKGDESSKVTVVDSFLKVLFSPRLF